MPSSEAQQRAIAVAVDSRPAEDQASVKALALELLAAWQRDAGGPVGIDIGTLKALEVNLRVREVTEGTGVRINEVVTPGALTVELGRVGPTRGKTER